MGSSDALDGATPCDDDEAVRLGRAFLQLFRGQPGTLILSTHGSHASVDLLVGGVATIGIGESIVDALTDASPGVRTKTCTGPCGRELPVSAFSPARRAGAKAVARQSRCRQCRAAAQRTNHKSKSVSLLRLPGMWPTYDDDD